MPASYPISCNHIRCLYSKFLSSGWILGDMKITHAGSSTLRVISIAAARSSNARTWAGNVGAPSSMRVLFIQVTWCNQIVSPSKQVCQIPLMHQIGTSTTFVSFRTRSDYIKPPSSVSKDHLLSIRLIKRPCGSFQSKFVNCEIDVQWGSTILWSSSLTTNFICRPGSRGLRVQLDPLTA